MSDHPRITLAKLENMTQYSPLVAFGFLMRERDWLAPILSRLQFPKHLHTIYPKETLVDLFVSILAGCHSVSQINSRIRPDRVLAQAWGRRKFAEQSTVARVLDACQEENVQQIRDGVNSCYRWFGQAAYHDWQKPLLIDTDLTALAAGQQAEGSTKGYFSEKKGGMVANSVA